MKIESNIPIPPSRRGNPLNTRSYPRDHMAIARLRTPRLTLSFYPFDSLAVGDSFHLCTGPGLTREFTASTLGTAARRWLKNDPDRAHIKFTTRQTETGARIWRIS